MRIPILGRVARLSTLLLISAALAACGGTDVQEQPAQELVWADEFNAPVGTPPDPDSWSYETFGDGSGNQELQCYTNAPGNASTDGQGHLVITALKQPGHRCVDGHVNDYTSARITTQASHTWEHGRLVVRARVPEGVGTWPAFWALGADKPEVGWPAAGEIDVMEYVGAQPTVVKGSIHGPTTTGERYYVTREHDTRAPLHDGFHDYSAEWDEDGIVWKIDGEPYGSVTRAQAEEQGLWVYDKPFYLLLNLAIGGSLGGPVPDTTAFPQQFLIDYVRVYQRRCDCS